MDFKGDIHTNGTPKSGQDSLVKKDHLATTGASFEMKMGDPIDKTGGKKEDTSIISGLSVGQIGNQCQGSLGENGFGQTRKTDMFGLTQQGMNPSANMNMGLPPFQSSKPPTMAESQMTSILPSNEPSKPLLAPNKPSDTITHNILDKPAGQAMLTHSPNKAEQSLSEPLGYQGVPHKEATSNEGSDEAVQQKKMKCETTEEAYSLLECLRSPEKTQSKSSNQEDSAPDNGESWKSEIREWGGGRIQAKKTKTRMKLPEEWANIPDSVKEDTTAKEKIEKMDTSSKADIINTPENTEKADTKKVDNVGRIQEKEKQDCKTEKNGKLEKVNNTEEIKKDMKEEKKNGGEKVDKTVKNEKNVKAAKETSKTTASNGTKDLISLDKVKSNKQNLSKPSSHVTGENSGITSNSANKKGPVAKKTSPTGTKKPPGITSSHLAKTSENNTSAQRKPPVPKFNGASAPKGSAGTKTSTSTVKPSLMKTSTNATSAASTDGAPRPSRITKPPVPKQVPQTKKPPVPRAPRNTRISNTPMPDLKNVSSKIGSTGNMKYQPSGGKVQIVHKKMDFSHITSRCGSKDNIKHIPGGGNVQILNKKVDLGKVSSKFGSKDNINHKPGGVNVKVESQKSKIKTKTGSRDDVSQEPGGDHSENLETHQKSEQSPPAPNPPIQTNEGVKETVPTPAPSEGQGLWNSSSQDKHISATSMYIAGSLFVVLYLILQSTSSQNSFNKIV
ncbi:microtubule-associated protein 4 isoform X3 [Silurus meridionalis]|nr:microtubule-associated protein 4 isoform X3 [Silurus meridionalis]